MNPRYLGLVGKIDWSIDKISQLQGRFGAVENTFQHKILPLFDHYTSIGTVGSTETDLYSDTIVGSTLAADGDKLSINYAGISTGSAFLKTIKVYFGGTACFTAQDLVDPSTKDWRLELTIIRVSSSVIRCYGNLNSTDNIDMVHTDYTEITGLDLSANNILKITGQVPDPGPPTPTDDELIATMGTVTWISHA